MFHSKSLQPQLIFFGSIEPFFGWKNLSTILHRRIFVALLTLYMAVSELIEHKLDKLFKKVIKINLLNLKVVALSMQGMWLLRVVHYLFILWCFHLSFHSLRLQSFTSNLIPTELDTLDQPHFVPPDLNFLPNLDISDSTFRKYLHLYLCAS